MTSTRQCAMHHYRLHRSGLVALRLRVFPANAAQIRAATATGRLAVPALAIGANSVGDALHRQLEPITDTLTGHVIPRCGHIIPLDQSDALLDLLIPFLTNT
jgi:pimeloyl-ACP methyl ester carboxylesterase